MTFGLYLTFDIVFLFDRPKLTGLDTGSTTDALFQVNDGRCFFLPSDCFRWACLLTEATHLTLLRIDPKFYETRTNQSRASFLLNVGLIFISKIPNRRKHGIRGCFSQTAVGSIFDVLAQLFQKFDVLHRSLPDRDAIQNVEHHFHPHPAGNALTTGFIDRKISEESGGIHHTDRIVRDDKTTRAHHCSCFIEGVKIDLNIQ